MNMKPRKPLPQPKVKVDLNEADNYEMREMW